MLKTSKDMGHNTQGEKGVMLMSWNTNRGECNGVSYKEVF